MQAGPASSAAAHPPGAPPTQGVVCRVVYRVVCNSSRSSRVSYASRPPAHPLREVTHLAASRPAAARHTPRASPAAPARPACAVPQPWGLQGGLRARGTGACVATSDLHMHTGGKAGLPTQCSFCCFPPQLRRATTTLTDSSLHCWFSTVWFIPMSWTRFRRSPLRGRSTAAAQVLSGALGGREGRACAARAPSSPLRPREHTAAAGWPKGAAGPHARARSRWQPSPAAKVRVETSASWFLSFWGAGAAGCALVKRGGRVLHNNSLARCAGAMVRGRAAEQGGMRRRTWACRAARGTAAPQSRTRWACP